MAGASDKARYFLEQSLPELHELERKKIFTKDEVNSIARKRSEFEHTVNARGSQPSDFARYAEYEMNLEALRKKRIKRSGVKGTTHNGQRRIFFVLDRATFKFKNDLSLWIQLIEYAKKQKANKKLEKVFTTVLRLHPTKPELWIYAARHVMDFEGDIMGARSYMQRGLRFCQGSISMWLEFARLEMLYITKIAARRQILGLDEEQSKEPSQDLEDFDADTITLPSLTAADLDPSLADAESRQSVVLKNLSVNPVLSGAIPLAIYDAAMKQFKYKEDYDGQFFDMFADFADFSITSDILRHVLADLQREHPDSSTTLTCNLRLILIGISPLSQDFPVALGKFLEQLKLASQDSPYVRKTLDARAVAILEPYRKVEGLDAGVLRVVNASLRRLRTSAAT